MGIAVGIVITLAVIAIIAWPFMNSKRRSFGQTDRLSPTARLRVAREEIYEQIRQLESDRDAGIISGDEYSSHLRELRISAAELMRAEERLPAEITVEDQLELEIEAARKSEPQENEGSPEFEKKD